MRKRNYSRDVVIDKVRDIEIKTPQGAPGIVTAHDEDTTKHNRHWYARSWQDDPLWDPRAEHRPETPFHQRHCQGARLSWWLRRGVQELDCGRGQSQRTHCFERMELIDWQLLDSIEDEVKQGGYIIDWHACDLFPKSWIDLVVVLRVDSTLLYDRLKAR